MSSAILMFLVQKILLPVHFQISYSLALNTPPNTPSPVSPTHSLDRLVY